MTGFSYTVSADLKATLRSIDDERIKLLTTPLNPKIELRLRWETMLDRVYYSLFLSGSVLSRKQMQSILLSLSLLKKPKRLSPEEKAVLKYKKALDIISQNWLLTDKQITPKTVVMLHEIGAIGTYRKKDQDLKQILDYLQTTTDHPVIQSAIIYAAVSGLRPFSDGNARISSLLSLLFLYKKGYDVRGLVCVEKEWAQNLMIFRKELSAGISNIHMTNWIEYYAKSCLTQLDGKLHEVSGVHPGTQEKSLFSLNERQKEILTLIEEPNASITNRQVKKYFDISQITASRDLARLASLGLLIPHGQGRSIYYTRV